MKLKLFTLLFAAFGLTATFTSCSNDDYDYDDNISNIIDSFKAKYADVNMKDVKWEVKGQYTVAEFTQSAGQVELEAWFDTRTGEWVMTEEDYGEDVFFLPGELNAKYYQTEYKTWNIDNMKLYTYPESSNDRYVFEVDKTGQQDMLLFFTADTYELVNAVVDTDQIITPDTAL